MNRDQAVFHTHNACLASPSSNQANALNPQMTTHNTTYTHQHTHVSYSLGQITPVPQIDGILLSDRPIEISEEISEIEFAKCVGKINDALHENRHRGMTFLWRGGFIGTAVAGCVAAMVANSWTFLGGVPAVVLFATTVVVGSLFGKVCAAGRDSDTVQRKLVGVNALLRGKKFRFRHDATVGVYIVTKFD